MLAQGQWFSPGTPASSTTKIGRHDIAEILLKVALNTKNAIQLVFFVLFFILLYNSLQRVTMWVNIVFHRVVFFSLSLLFFGGLFILTL
jgi:hypothetical protein